MRLGSPTELDSDEDCDHVTVHRTPSSTTCAAMRSGPSPALGKADISQACADQEKRKEHEEGSKRKQHHAQDEEALRAAS